jgi:hypothetical protein
MTGAEIQAAYFSPFHLIMYLVIIFILMIVYYQWKWSKHCAENVRVLVVMPDGSTETEYAPKTGNYVALKVPESNTVRLWPINKLASVDMQYPGDGFIPGFLQKKIRMVIVDSEDWEPMLNRGSYSRMVASPDVVQILRDLADDYPDAKEALNDLADSVSTAATRDMIASPAVLGNILKEKVSELAVSISRETFDKLEGVTKRLDRMSKPTVIYVGLGVVAIMLVILLFNVIPALTQLSTMASDLEAVKKVLGVP